MKKGSGNCMSGGMDVRILRKWELKQREFLQQPCTTYKPLVFSVLSGFFPLWGTMRLDKMSRMKWSGVENLVKSEKFLFDIISLIVMM